jgi:hypothetical protein
LIWAGDIWGSVKGTYNNNERAPSQPLATAFDPILCDTLKRDPVKGILAHAVPQPLPRRLGEERIPYKALRALAEPVCDFVHRVSLVEQGHGSSMAE